MDENWKQGTWLLSKAEIGIPVAFLRAPPRLVTGLVGRRIPARKGDEGQPVERI